MNELHAYLQQYDKRNLGRWAHLIHDSKELILYNRDLILSYFMVPPLAFIFFTII